MARSLLVDAVFGIESNVNVRQPFDAKLEDAEPRLNPIGSLASGLGLLCSAKITEFRSRRSFAGHPPVMRYPLPFDLSINVRHPVT